ncbi:MAG: adenylate/guanylate cyclase domain-containing protein, partial [Bacteroidota bacterium]
MQQPPREQAFRAGRRQVAILFADIQGYTAVMGTDEPLAQRYLALFREHLHQAVPAHNGEVINFYGDGCVATFESAVDATNCSIRLQTAFQNSDPVLPVRIGLHSGEVFFDESSVYGDNVNIASRVESMGVPGSVLVSARIYRDIANKGIFTAEDLGPFEFKNVDEPMNLFAITAAELVVPAREELNGKGRALPRERANRIPAAGKRWPLAMAAGILFLLAGYWFFLRGSFTAEEGYYATDEIRSARIAV